MLKIKEHVEDIIKTLYGIDISVDLIRTELRFGDFSTNVALTLSSRLKLRATNIAESIISKFDRELIYDVSIAGPGFINIKLRDESLVAMVNQRSKKPYKEKQIIIETNGQNLFKPGHIGHALNAVASDTVANLLEKGGAKLKRVSYHGDVGLNIGKSMYSILGYINGDIKVLTAIPERDRGMFLQKMYKKGSLAYKENEQSRLEIDELAKKSFGTEDKLYKTVYDIVSEWSIIQIDADMKRLGNKPIGRKFFESEADGIGVKIVEENTPNVFKKSQGAYIFEGSKHGSFDNTFVSSKGTGLYAARDLGLIEMKKRYFDADVSYIVTAVEQKDYFKGVIEAAKGCYLVRDDEMVNISTGVVKLPDGKMSSRTGDVVNITWLFDTISEALVARGGFVEEDILIAVIRYQLLRVHLGSDIVFDINEAINVNGNSGLYLQYAHARASSIMSKIESEKDLGLADGVIFEQGERAFLLKLTEYTEVVNKAIEDLKPHVICNYLYELSQLFNRFYEQNKVVAHERESVRAYLVSRYVSIMRDGLSILGIASPEAIERK